MRYLALLTLVTASAASSPTEPAPAWTNSAALTAHLGFPPPTPLTSQPGAGGGTYNGPGDTGSGGGPRPSTPGPAGPAAPSSPGTRGPAGPAAPATPRGPVMPVGPSTGSGSGVALDPAAWHTWWELHKEPYLLLKDAIYLAPTSTGSDEFFLGHGEQPSIQDLRPDAQHIVDSVVPALLAILTEDEMSSVVSSATMAVAKIGAEACGDRAGDVEAALRALLESGNQEVVETAVLGLGLFGRQSSAMDVAAVLADTKAGQELTGGGKVTARTRAFAAYGMAELARRSKNKEVARFAAQHLVGVVDSHKAPDVVRLACLNALAVVPLSSVGYVEAGGVRVAPSSSRSALVEWLAAKCKEKKLSDRVRAHAPRTMALHALGGDTSLREEAIGVLVELLARGRTDRELRYGAVMGLGLLGHAGEGHAWVRKSLMRSAREGDATERHLALMSLGQVGSRPGADPKTAWEGADAIEAYLRQQLAKGKSRAKPWAALALGVQGAEQLSHGRTLNPETRDALRMMSQDCKSPADAGAYAVAIGLRTDIGAADILSEKLAYFSDQQARGDICLSLGLLREIGNVPALQEVFTKAVYQPHLLSRVITALTLSQDKSLVPTILKEMEANESSSVRIVYAWALGIVGDARAVEPLTEILLDKENVAMLRAKSADCLGFVCDPERVPWNTSLKRAANYITRAETVLGSGSPGVLEFR